MNTSPIQSPEPKASRNDVRVLGAVFIVSGGVLVYFGRDWAMDGIVPVPVLWIGVAIITLGLVLQIIPEPFRRRASRFNEIAESFSRKPPADPPM